MERMKAFNIFQDTVNQIISGKDTHQAIEEAQLDSLSDGEYWMEYNDDCEPPTLEFWTDGDNGEEVITLHEF